MGHLGAEAPPLVGKVALVTGGARGLGFEISRQLAALGVHVIVAARDEIKGQAAVAQLHTDGLRANFLRLDVNREDDRQAAYDSIRRSHGVLDILVNNAAVYLDSENAATPSPRLASGTAEGVLRKTFETNFFGPVLLTQILLPLLRLSTAGRIVNLSSIRGSLTHQADPTSPIAPRAFAYDASKSALNAFTVQLAQELRNTTIKVNSIHPGWVRTKMGSDDADLSVQEGARTVIPLRPFQTTVRQAGFSILRNGCRGRTRVSWPRILEIGSRRMPSIKRPHRAW